MLMVTFIFFLLMMLFVDVGSSRTAEDGVELIEVLHLAVVVLIVPVLAEELAPISIATCERLTVGGAGRTPLTVRPCRLGGRASVVIEATERARGAELQHREDAVGQAYLHMYVLCCHDGQRLFVGVD